VVRCQSHLTACAYTLRLAATRAHWVIPRQVPTSRTDPDSLCARFRSRNRAKSRWQPHDPDDWIHRGIGRLQETSHDPRAKPRRHITGLGMLDPGDSALHQQSRKDTRSRLPPQSVTSDYAALQLVNTAMKANAIWPGIPTKAPERPPAWRGCPPKVTRFDAPGRTQCQQFPERWI